MMPEQQQRILGYFIEEAKDHLNTIEQGLLNLQATIQDPEMVSEVFRAAHSVKGGAAMLSLGSIQRTAHRLEDYFKVLKETPTTQVDRELESMFLQVFDGLQALLEELQGPFGLTEDKAQEVMADIEPVFERLEQHLNTLVANAPAIAPTTDTVQPATTATAAQVAVGTSRGEDSALKLVFTSDVPGYLREMLTLFKQSDTEASRAALQAACNALYRIGEQFDLDAWCQLTSATRRVVGNVEQTYRALAPIVIKELKRAQEQVLAGQTSSITISSEFEALMPLSLETDEDAISDIDALLDEALSTTEESDFADLFAADNQPVTGAENDLDWLEFSSSEAQEDSTSDDLDLTETLVDFSGEESLAEGSSGQREPAVGAAELNSLADLFEGEVSGLESPWEEVAEGEAAIAANSSLDIDISDDFSDLLGSSATDDLQNNEQQDLADLFGETAPPETQLMSSDGVADNSLSESNTKDIEQDDFADLFDLSDRYSENISATEDEEGDGLLDSISEGEDDISYESNELTTPELANDTETLNEDDNAIDGANDFSSLFSDSSEAADDVSVDEALETAISEDLILLNKDNSPSDAEELTASTNDSESEDSDSFTAIADPWSTEEIEDEVADESALDALDELWTEANSTAEDTETAAAIAEDKSSLDFEDLDLETEWNNESAEADFDDLFSSDSDDVGHDTMTPDFSSSDKPTVDSREDPDSPSSLEDSVDFESLEIEAASDFEDLPTESSITDSLELDNFEELLTENPETNSSELDSIDADLGGLFTDEAEVPSHEQSDLPIDLNFDESTDDLEANLATEDYSSNDDFLNDLSVLNEESWEDETAAVEQPFEAFTNVSDSPANLETVEPSQQDSELETDSLEIIPESTSSHLSGDDLEDFDLAFAETEDELSVLDTAKEDLNDPSDTQISIIENATDTTDEIDSFLDELGQSNLQASQDYSTDFFGIENSSNSPQSAEDTFDLESELITTGFDDSASVSDSIEDDIDDFFETSSSLEETTVNEISASQKDDDSVDLTEDTFAAEESEEHAEEIALTDEQPLDELFEDVNLRDSDSAENADSDLASLPEVSSDFSDEVDPFSDEASSEDNEFDSLDDDSLSIDVEGAINGDVDEALQLNSDLDFEDENENTESDDLDVLLAESNYLDNSNPPDLEANQADSNSSHYDDLDDSLNEDINAAVFSDSEAVDTPGSSIDFDELDALLDDDFPIINDLATTASESDSHNFETTTNEFSDLEKLLEEADQTLGGTSPSIRSTSGSRAPRRVGGIVDQTMRVSVKHLDNLNNLVGELVVNRNSLEQDQERLRQFLDNLLFQVQQLNDVGQRMRDLYERSLLESSLLASRQAFQSGSLSRLSDSFRGNGGDHATGATFDALEMDRFTGFHTLTQEMIELIVRVRESASDIAYTVESTDQIARQFRQVTTQLQEGLNKARMVPFAQTADRLPRAVRDISIKCGKEARLLVEGRETLIDKMILERLYDPMTHLVNNAITHGIETPEERAALGKPREGTITIRAFYQGNQTVIYIADDGGGINPDIVKRKALQKGMITRAEAESMSILDTYELLFRHGFSTRDQADDFAGRGVGMDVVRTALSEIRGSITIDSELGKGTSFTIRLPLTLSISKALSCLNNQARIAFPMDGVEDMFDVPQDRIQADSNGESFIQWRDTALTFQPLSELLQFNRSLGRGRVYGGSQDEDMVSIVVLRNANTYIGIQVDRVLGEQEIVIKQIEGPVPKPMGIAGATVLGDGRVMPIADVLELIDIAQGRVRREAGSSLWSQVELPPEEDVVAAKTEPTVLIVDDSITVRELLSMSFNKVGYRVEQARDGQEAWEKMRSGLPCDLVFCDIEMPRMDGLELLSRMQKDSVLKHVPIAMLTSRGADRHRQMAVDLGASGYFTKPYLEEALLDAAQRMLKGEVLISRMSEELE